MRRHAWEDTANKQTRISSNYLESPHLAWTTTSSEKKNLNLWKNYQKVALASSSHVYFWRASADLTFYCLQINWHERSQSGAEPVTTAWIRVQIVSV